MRILLTGPGGQLGFELRRTLAPLGPIHACDRRLLDMRYPDAIRRVVREIRPHVIVNAAAYTAVDRAETEPREALAINAIGPGILAEEARRLDAVLVHYSTDYVFDGQKQEPYDENDTPRPLGEYGRSKLEGERNVAAAAGAYLIFRVSWLYAARGHNFMRTIARLAAERDELRVVDDQRGSPTWARLVAEATALVIGKVGPSIPQYSGLYHLACGGAASWYDFAQAIVTSLAARNPGRAVRVVPIASNEYPSRVPRPRNSLMSCAKVERQFGLALPAWEEALALCEASMTAS
jgi:dTDP-4-dehydrorhamnose reductase